MKKYIVFTCSLLASVAFSQIAIGKNTTSQDAILDFGSENKGIILPIADPTNGTYANGTILMDKNEKIIKAYQNGEWLELSDEGSFDEQLDINGDPISTAAQLNSSNEVGNGVIIGEDNSGVEGVLVLNDSSKALVLPKVNRPHENIKSPVAGTICYDTDSDSLAVFDGKVWSYWK